MSKREFIVREIDHMPERDLDKLLSFVLALRADDNATLAAVETALAKDWSTREEYEAWASL